MSEAETVSARLDAHISQDEERVSAAFAAMALLREADDKLSKRIEEQGELINSLIWKVGVMAGAASAAGGYLSTLLGG